MYSYPANINTINRREFMDFPDFPESGLRVTGAQSGAIAAAAHLLMVINLNYIAKARPIPMPSDLKHEQIAIRVPQFEWMKIQFYNTLLAAGKYTANEFKPLLKGSSLGMLELKDMTDLLDWIHTDEMEHMLGKLGKKFQITVV